MEHTLRTTRRRTGRTLLLKSHTSFVVTTIERTGSHFDTGGKNAQGKGRTFGLLAL
jgi:hypothetical protein